MKGDNTKKIDQYISGELSIEEKKQFETELENNSTLRNEFELQKNIINLAERVSIRETVKSVGKRHHFIKLTKWIGGIIVIIAIIGVGIYISLESKSIQENSENVIPSKMSTSTKQKELIPELPVEIFSWDGKDTVYLSQSGVIISVPSKAILRNGKPFTGKASLEWQEAIDGATIMKNGLSTMADSNLLETQGMFSLRIHTVEGELLKIDPDIGIYIQVAVDEFKPGMQLYDGEYDQDNVINWINPVPLEKIPVPIPMSELDFYPRGYEDTLNKLKLNQKKKYRDSVYLACEYMKEDRSNSGSKIKPELPSRTMTVVKKLESNAYSNSKIKVNKIKNGQFDHLLMTNAKVVQKTNNTYEITVDFNLKDNWFLYESVDDKGMISSIDVSNKNSNIEYISNTIIRSNFKNTSEDDLHNNYWGNVTISRTVKVLDNRKSLNFELGYMIANRIRALFPQEEIFEVILNAAVNEKYIPPSKVLAFWNEKFNNTILATRDFEKRMRVIHETCDESLLKLYTRNLDKPLYYMDSIAVERGYSQFEVFFAERVGKLEVDNAHVRSLEKLYQNGITSLREDLQKQRELYRAENRAFDEELVKERIQQALRTSSMENKMMREETRFNLKQKPLNNQSGSSSEPFISSTSLITVQQQTRSVGFRINRNNVIKNIDREVALATLNRTNFKGSYAGKNIDVRYNDFSVAIEDYNSFSRLFTYILPNKFNSYQRLKGVKGKFEFKMNNDLKYDVVVLGFNESGFFYYENTNLNKGEFKNISLTAISESDFEKRLAQLNKTRMDEPSELKNELMWLKLEQENYRLRKDIIQRNRLLKRIRKVVFPCMKFETESSPKFDFGIGGLSDQVIGDIVPFPDQEAQFIEGYGEMLKFIQDAIKYPKSEMENGIQGRVIVQFTVEIDGSITNLIILKSVSPGLDKEAIRVVRSLPSFNSAITNGKMVQSFMRIPINFIMN